MWKLAREKEKEFFFEIMMEVMTGAYYRMIEAAQSFEQR